MQSDDGDQVKLCPCFMACEDCTTGFQKVIDLKNAGLVIYRHTIQTEDIHIDTGIADSAKKVTGDVFILQNTNDIELTSADYLPEMEQSNISCPRCRNIIEHAQILLEQFPIINRNDVIGVCDHCKMKERSCLECKGAVQKFFTNKSEPKSDTKERVKIWLSKIKRLLKDAFLDEKEAGERKRAYSELYIDQICRNLPKEECGPLIKDMFHPEMHRSDLLGADRSKRKYGIKLHDIQFQDEPPLKRLFSPGREAKFDSEKGAGSVVTTEEDYNFFSSDDARLFKATTNDYYKTKRRKEEKHAVLRKIPPAPFQSKEEFSLEREGSFIKDKITRGKTHPSLSRKKYISDVSDFKQISKTDSRPTDYKTRSRSPPERHEADLSDFRQILETEDRPTIYTARSRSQTQKYVADVSDFRKILKNDTRLLDEAQVTRIRDQRMQETKQDILQPTFSEQYVQDDRHLKKKAELGEEQITRSYVKEYTPVKGFPKEAHKAPTEIRKYHSEEALITFVAGVAEEELKKDFSFSFPKEINVAKKLKRQKTSTELIKDTQDKLLAKAEEEKRRLEEERKRKAEKEERERLAGEEKRKLAEERKKVKEQRKKAEEEERLKKEIERQLQEEEKLLELKRRKEDKERAKLDKEIAKLDKEIAKKEKAFSTHSADTTKSEGKKSKPESKEKPELKEKVKPEPKEKAKPERKEKNKPAPRENPEPKEKLKPQPALREKPEPKEKPIAEPAAKEKPEPEPALKEKPELKEKPKLKPVSKEKPDPKEPPKPELKEKAERNVLKPERDEEKARRELEKKEKEERLKKEKEENERLRKEREEQARKEKEMKQKQKELMEEGNREKEKKAREEAALRLRKAQEEPVKPEKEKPKTVEKPESPTIKELHISKVKVRKPSADSLILQLVKLRQATGQPMERIRPKRLSQMNMTQLEIDAHKQYHKTRRSPCIMCNDSDLEYDFDDDVFQKARAEEIAEVIIGRKIFKYKPPLPQKVENRGVVPLLFQSTFDELAVNAVISEKTINEPKSTSREKVLPTVMGKQTKTAEQEVGKGVIRYALSDRTFIDKGWTMLPTEKVVRKMNVYRMRPAKPEFDWFEHNKNKRLMEYDTGEKLAEFDDNGRGRWYYRNGRLALDYYDAEETNAQQRFVIFSSGEPDERGRSQPYCIIATFDYLGNGIVFDHNGKIRMKYNQTEGVVLDRSIGPVSHWKWHTLNDPPVLQQVMIDTQMAHKDPEILKMGGPHDDKTRPDNEEMLAIEFDNFIKEKSKKLSQTFKPFQIKMKALKINEHFSLKVLDQATVYLIFRDGTTNLKLNIGMILDHKEIVDTDTAEVGEVSNSLERFPARTDSLAGLQKSIAYAQRFERNRTERERRLRPPEPCGSADKLTAAASRPLRPPLRTAPTGSTTTTGAGGFCHKCSRKPSANNIYYDSRLF